MTGGAYCQKSGEVASNVVCNICMGMLSVKGNGIQPKDDEYGKPYTRACVHSVAGANMVVERATGTSAIAGCTPAAVPVAR